MKFLVIGCGSIGKRHINNLIKIGIEKNNISVVDPRKDRLNQVNEIGLTNVFENLDDALKHKYDASVVCSPTSMHISQSQKLLSNNINILMEKPLCSDLNGIEEVVELKNKKNLTFMMGYIFRFSPQTHKVRELLTKNSIGKILYARGEFSEYLPDWHPYEDYRSFYMARKDLGGGSILDQCHIMDLFHHLIGDFNSVFAFNSKISDLEIEADDVAELMIEFKNGVLGSIHTDIFGRKHKKKFEIKGTEGNIICDFYEKKVIFYDSLSKKEEIFDNFDNDFNNNYIDEIQTFINACNDKTIKYPDLDVGIHTMKLILNSEKSHKSKKLEII